jgi:hypothetical protein
MLKVNFNIRTLSTPRRDALRYKLSYKIRMTPSDLTTTPLCSASEILYQLGDSPTRSDSHRGKKKTRRVRGAERAACGMYMWRKRYVIIE